MTRPAATPARGAVRLRTAERSEAGKLLALITANLVEGHLLPRTLDEISTRTDRFVVAIRGRKIVGCAELASLSPSTAEVRSLAVDPSVRGGGVGGAIVSELASRARRQGFEKLCAFTHAPAYFAPMGFSIVPHSWVFEKITSDCVGCAAFRSCGQYAMVRPLDAADASLDATQMIPVHDLRHV